MVGGFDMDRYLTKYAFAVIRRKEWQAHPGGLIFELAQCPFDAEHAGGSAAFTLVDGTPGFRCQHNGCRGRTIKDVFAGFPPDSTESGSAEDRPPRASQSRVLVECAAGAEFFHTPEGEAFASLTVGDHREIWPLKSRGCRRWLTRAFYQRCGRPPGAQAMQDALSVLEAKAQFDSPACQVFTRVAPCGDRIYIDLGNEKWEAVEVTSDGWRIVQNPSVRFRRSRSMQPLPIPARSGSISKLRSLINVGDDKNWILLLSWLVAASRPQGPYPLLILQGEQGSAKSTTAKLLRRIIDPATAPLRTPPREERDLLIAANNSWVVAYDNLSGIPQWLSDALCRLATGGGFSTRELYTDTEEVILDLTRPVILNGIDHLAERPDLADRAIILNLPRIAETARRDEADVYAEYDRERPQILGALMTAVSAALDRLPKVRLFRKPRMADFALWATAAEEALGFRSGSFMSAYSGNRAQAVQETLESDPVSAAIAVFVDEKETEGQWTGTCGELLKHLERIVGDGVKRQQAWPKTPRGLSGRLRRLTTFLRESGIEITFPDSKGSGGQRLLTIIRIAADETATTATANSKDTVVSMNQRARTDSGSGGWASGGAVEPHEGDQPPPEAPVDIPSDSQFLRNPGTEMADGAVVSGTDLRPQPKSDVRIDLCFQCGKREWKWNGGAWVCGACGKPARGLDPSLRQTELDSASETEPPMSPTGATTA